MGGAGASEEPTSARFAGGKLGGNASGLGHQFSHVPGATVFQDSHKFVALIAHADAEGVGMGVERIAVGWTRDGFGRAAALSALFAVVVAQIIMV